MGPRLKRRIAHRMDERINADVCGLTLGLVFDDIHEAAGGMGLDPPQQPQGARDTAQIDGFALDRAYKAQSISPGRSLSRAPVLIKIMAWMRPWIFAA